MIDRKAMEKIPGASGLRASEERHGDSAGQRNVDGGSTIGCNCNGVPLERPEGPPDTALVMLEWDGHRVMIDSGPDFREQALREGIDRLDAVLYTHGHADHILGLDDLRPLTYPRVTGGGKLPLYAKPRRRTFCVRFSSTFRRQL